MLRDISEYFSSILAKIADVLPEIVLSILILTIGYLTARIVERLVRKFILFINDGVNQRLEVSTLYLDLRGSARFISLVVFWIIMAVAVLICIHVLRLYFFKDLFESIVGYLPNIVVAIIIVFAGIICGRLLGDLIKAAAIRSGVVASRSFLSIAVRYFVLFISIIIAADQLGIHIDFLIDVIDIILACVLFGAALAFGLGAKDSVSHILASYYIKKQHQLGTKVKMGQKIGTIVKISDHSIHLETAEGRLIVPAKTFNESEVIIIREEDDE